MSGENMSGENMHPLTKFAVLVGMCALTIMFLGTMIALLIQYKNVFMW